MRKTLLFLSVIGLFLSSCSEQRIKFYELEKKGNVHFYENSEFDGVAYELDGENQLTWEVIFDDGISEWKYYYDEDGQVEKEGALNNNGQEEGEWKYYLYYEGGQVYQIGGYLMEGGQEGWDKWEYRRKNTHGECKVYYKNGQLEQIGNYVRGQEEGEWKYYYENGQLEQIGNYVRGQKEGEWKYYYENGRVRKHERFD